MKQLLLFVTLSLSFNVQADLLDIDPVSLCTLFEHEGVFTTKYGVGSNPKGKLCYIPRNRSAHKNNGYLLSYRVLGHFRWTDLTGKVFISIKGDESKIQADNMLAKYKRMVFSLIDKVTSNINKKKIKQIVNDITTKRSTSQSVEAMLISSYISRKEYNGKVFVEYRIDISNQCSYHPSDPEREGCIADRIKESITGKKL